MHNPILLIQQHCCWGRGQMWEAEIFQALCSCYGSWAEKPNSCQRGNICILYAYWLSFGNERRAPMPTSHPSRSL